MKLPDGTVRYGPTPKPLEERFWVKVHRRSADECWPWQGARYKDGPPHYGEGFLYAGYEFPGLRWLSAPRAAWTLTRGPIPDGLCVCHTCDYPRCCNPAHLWLGTRADNNLDRHLKDRDSKAFGEDGYWAKLTDEQVLEMRRRYATEGVSQMRLAEEYGIKQPQVSRIIRRESWGHI